MEQGLQQLITQLGFPIACCIGLGWFLFKVWNEQNDATKALMESMRQEYQSRENRILSQLDNFANSLKGIDATLQKLDSRLERLENKE